MIGRAFGAFFRDLFAGDVVALSVVGVVLLVVLLIGVAGFFILRSRRKEEERHRKKLYGKYQNK